MSLQPETQQALQRGLVIPACPLALTAGRKLDERRQRALLRYYAAAGAGGVAIGVHTTQFAIRDSRHGLFEPVLALAAEELTYADAGRREPLVRIGGVCGETPQATREAVLLRELLTRERWPEVGVTGPYQPESLLGNGCGPFAIAGPPALARDEPSRAVLAQGAAKALDLAQAEAELLGGLSLRQATFDHAAEDLEPVEFLRTHR